MANFASTGIELLFGPPDSSLLMTPQTKIVKAMRKMEVNVRRLRVIRDLL
jgi:hypothetical protein